MLSLQFTSEHQESSPCARMVFQSPGNGTAIAAQPECTTVRLDRKISRSMSSMDNGLSATFFSSLGHDHLVLILERLSIRSVLSFGLTCKQGSEAASSDAVWKTLCRKEWGEQANEVEPVVKRVQGGWKEVCRQLSTLQCAHWQQLQMEEQGPCRRASHSLLLAEGKVVTIAGGCDGGRDLNDTWAANPSAITEHPDQPSPLTWRLLSAGEVPGRFGQCSVAVPERHTIVIFGGINDRGLRLNDTWALDDVAGCGEATWRKLELADSPSPRGAPGGCFGGGQKVVVFGGLAQDNTRHNDTWILDFAVEPLSWRKVDMASGPQARSGHTMTWLGDGRIVLFGGRNMVFEMLNDVWCLDMLAPGGPKWQEVWAPERYPSDDAPVARSGHTATAVLGGRVLVIGGEDMSRNRKGDVWLLDPDAGSAPPKSSGERTGGSGVNGVAHDRLENGVPSISESDSSDGEAVVPQMSEESPGRKVWQRLQVAGNGPSRRSFHAAARLAGSSIMLFGGMVDGELLPGQAGGLKFDDEIWLLNLVA